MITRDDESPRFDAGIYARLFETLEAQAMWRLMNAPDNVIRMTTATLLGRPALEGIEEQLLESLGGWILDDEPKKLAGRMARQVMERHGCIVDIGNVKSMNGAPFSKMTRYRRPGDMTFHIFRSRKDRREAALTATRDAEAALPPLGTDDGWVYDRPFVGDLRARVAFGVPDCAAARVAIAADGFYRYRQERVLRAG
jgi:hypothetical protein